MAEERVWDSEARGGWELKQGLRFQFCFVGLGAFAIFSCLVLLLLLPNLGVFVWCACVCVYVCPLYTHLEGRQPRTDRLKKEDLWFRTACGTWQKLHLKNKK